MSKATYFYYIIMILIFRQWTNKKYPGGDTAGIKQNMVSRAGCETDRYQGWLGKYNTFNHWGE